LLDEGACACFVWTKRSPAATSALDSASEEAVNAAIDSIIREKSITVILAAHRLSSIARAERVIVIENGVVSEEGRYDVLVSGVSAEICDQLTSRAVKRAAVSGH